MNEKEIVKMCDRLAYKYNNKGHREDMKMEGILKCYEILGEEPNVHPAKLYREAKRRMHDYLNVETLPVTVPAHNITRRLTRDINDGEVGDMSETGHKWLKVILSSKTGQYNDEHGISLNDHTEMYETKDLLKCVLNAAHEELTAEELGVIKMRFFDDMTQDDVATATGTNQKWVSRKEESAITKLRNSIL